MPNLDFFPEEVQECIKDFEFNKPELGLESIQSNIIDETRHGVVYEYVFKYKDVFYKFHRESIEDSDMEFEEECSSSDKDNMFKIVVPKEVVKIEYI